MSNNRVYSSNAALQRQYEATLPPNDIKNHFVPSAQHQPDTNCDDHIPKYGIGEFRVNYDGVYKRPVRKVPKQTDCGPHRTLLATAGIDHESYGPVMSHYNITDDNLTNKTLGPAVEYVKSEMQIKRDRGEPIFDREDVRLPIPLRVRDDDPADPNIQYDGDYHYDWNSKIWTVRDLPNYGEYPYPLEHLDFSKRFDLVEPEKAFGTSGSEACIVDGPTDVFDPHPDVHVLTSRRYAQLRDNSEYLNGLKHGAIARRNPNFNPNNQYQIPHVGSDVAYNPFTRKARLEEIKRQQGIIEEYDNNPGVSWVSVRQSREDKAKNQYDGPYKAIPNGPGMNNDDSIPWEEAQHMRPDQKFPKNKYHEYNVEPHYWGISKEKLFHADARVPDSYPNAVYNQQVAAKERTNFNSPYDSRWNGNDVMYHHYPYQRHPRGEPARNNPSRGKRSLTKTLLAKFK